MATRSIIAILNNDGTITAISCHWDGYLEWSGQILSDYYQYQLKVKELIRGGNLSSLRQKIEPNGEHTFENPQNDVCIYYHRDRGENWEINKPKNYNGLDELWDMFWDSDKEFLYIYIGDDWYYAHYSDRKCSLKHLKTKIKSLVEEENAE